MKLHRATVFINIPQWTSREEATFINLMKPEDGGGIDFGGVETWCQRELNRSQVVEEADK